MINLSWQMVGQLMSYDGLLARFLSEFRPQKYEYLEVDKENVETDMHLESKQLQDSPKNKGEELT